MEDGNLDSEKLKKLREVSGAFNAHFDDDSTNGTDFAKNKNLGTPLLVRAFIFDSLTLRKITSIYFEIIDEVCLELCRDIHRKVKFESGCLNCDR